MWITPKKAVPKEMASFVCLFDVSPERLNQMTPLELEEDMEQALEAMTEETYDPEIVDAYLAALDCKAPMPTPPNQEAAYGALQAMLNQAIKGQEKVFKSGTSSGRRRSAIRIGLAVAAAVVCLLGSMVIAQAAGADVFGVLARWTEQAFSFGSVRSNDPKEPVDSDPQQENNEEFASKLSPEYQELWAELQARGVYSFSFPTYLPDGFEFDESDLWIPVEEMPCMHGKPFGTDLKYERSRVVTMKCNTCGRGTSTTEHDYKVECHGYNG